MAWLEERRPQRTMAGGGASADGGGPGHDTEEDLGSSEGGCGRLMKDDGGSGGISAGRA
jgi:hypothetical protein